MNNYIIDPKVFYWINVCGNLQTACAIIGVSSVVAGICCLIGSIYYKNGSSCHNDETAEKLYKMNKKYYQILFIIGIPFIMFSIFIPGKATSVEMLIAKTATFENTELTINGIKEVVDYIVTAIKSVV